jgi:hypothetical protein
MRRLLWTFLGGDLQKHILQAHSNWTKLQQPPSATDDDAGEIATDVDIRFALYLEGERA